MNDNQLPSHQEEQPEADQQGDSATADPEPRSETGLNTKQEEPGTEKRDNVEEEQQETEEGGGGVSDGEEGKGVKRKREEVLKEEEVGQSTEKKKVKMSSLVLSFMCHLNGAVLLKGIPLFIVDTIK